MAWSGTEVKCNGKCVVAYRLSSLSSVNQLASCSAHLDNVASILVLGPQRVQRMTGNAFRIFIQPELQIDNGFSNRPIMAHT